MSTEIFVANTTHHVEVDGVPMLVRKDQRVEKGHEALSLNPQYFTTAEAAPTLSAPLAAGEAAQDPSTVAAGDLGQGRAPGEGVHPDPGAGDVPQLPDYASGKRETVEYLTELAGRRGVAVADVQGTGPDGRVTKHDLLVAMGVAPDG